MKSRRLPRSLPLPVVSPRTRRQGALAAVLALALGACFPPRPPPPAGLRAGEASSRGAAGAGAGRPDGAFGTGVALSTPARPPSAPFTLGLRDAVALDDGTVVRLESLDIERWSLGPGDVERAGATLTLSVAGTSLIATWRAPPAPSNLSAPVPTAPSGSAWRDALELRVTGVAGDGRSATLEVWRWSPPAASDAAAWSSPVALPNDAPAALTPTLTVTLLSLLPASPGAPLATGPSSGSAPGSTGRLRLATEEGAEEQAVEVAPGREGLSCWRSWCLRYHASPDGASLSLRVAAGLPTAVARRR